jgi:dTDP-4-amino-4,6-dideoxygalactose transaminase
VSVPYDERWRSVHASDIDAIAGHAMRDVTTLSKGDGAIADFERRFAQVTGTRHALAMNSGTASLHSAYFAAGVSPGSEVIVPSYTFFASAAPILQCGATAVFCDVDRRTLTADPADVERRITPRTRAICVVHMWGNPAPLDRFAELARRHGVALIEDCSHAHGASYLGRPVGGWGDIGCFSLQGAKAVSGGEAGIAVTDDPELFDRMLLLGHYGRLKKGQAKDTFDTDHLSLGLKYRPHLYAVLLAQGSLSRSTSSTDAAADNYAILTEELDGCRAVQPIPTTPGAVRGGFLEYILRYDPEHAGGLRRDEFIAAAKAEGVPIAPERYSAVGRRARLLHESPRLRLPGPVRTRDGTPPSSWAERARSAAGHRSAPRPAHDAPSLHKGAGALRPPMRPSIAQGGRGRGRGGAIRAGQRGGSRVMLAPWLEPVRDALDNAAAPVPVFIRDDDAGWDDERLIACSTCSPASDCPSTSRRSRRKWGAALARELCERIDAPGPPVGVHQHGLAHVNHEREGRKAEFGASRSAGDQRRDILEGRGGSVRSSAAA